MHPAVVAVLDRLSALLGFELTLPVLLGTVLALASAVAYLTAKPPVALDKEEWRDFKLVGIEKVSHDVRKFRFALPSKEHVFGLPVGTHVYFKFTDAEGKEVQRNYTPISSNDEKGFAEFLIKVYYPHEREIKGVMTKIPGGRMSMHLDSMKIGDTIKMRGPKGHLLYKGRGRFSLHRTATQPEQILNTRKIGLVAGGTGITPMLQIIRAILKDPKDRTEVWLLFANQSEDDILLRQELEALPRDRFHLHFTVDRLKRTPSSEWPYGVGFIDDAMCSKHLPQNQEGVFYVACGPPAMYKFAVEPAFQKLNIPADKYILL